MGVGLLRLIGQDLAVEIGRLFDAAGLVELLSLDQANVIVYSIHVVKSKSGQRF